MDNKWTYQICLEKHKVANRFNNFFHFLARNLEGKRKRARSVGALPSKQVNLDPSDCALVYNPQPGHTHPKVMIHTPLYLDDSSEDTPHLIMMVVLANLISEKDPEFEEFINKKISEYITEFEKI